MVYVARRQTHPRQAQSKKQLKGNEMIFPLKDGTEWELTEDKYKLVNDRFPLIDIDAELDKFKTWLLFNESRQKTARGMMRAIGHWMSNDSIPKAQRKPVSDKAKQYDSQCGPWLRGASLQELSNSDRFKQMLKVPGFRAWAEKENVFVKGMK